MGPNDGKPDNETQSMEDVIFQNVGAVEEAPYDAQAPEAEAPVVDDAEPAVEGGDAEAKPEAADDTPPADAPVLSEHEQNVEDEIKALGLTKDDTQRRFRELANEAREGREYRETVQAQEKVFQHLESSGITGEQFGMMTAIAGDVNSNDPARLDRAYQALSAELASLGKKLGKEAPGYDPLSEFPELAKRVDEGDIDRATAVELAGARRREAVTREHVQVTHAQSEQTRQLNATRDGLNALEAELKANDPDYSRKRAILEPIMRATLPGVPADKWVATYAEAYAKLQLPAAAPVVTRPDPANARRPEGGAGGARPKNAEEAVLAALGLSPGA
jgi:hypothetical protein